MNAHILAPIIVLAVYLAPFYLLRAILKRRA